MTTATCPPAAVRTGRRPGGRPRTWRPPPTEMPTRYHLMVTKSLHTIQRRATAGQVRVNWVKGHAGHPLQEVADRLAVLGRRRHQAGLNDLERRIQEIAAEFVRMSLAAPP